jgi:two-component system CheB/CheR fusion protein
VVWVRGECRVVRDGDGRPLFLQGIAYDITESKEAEEALRRTHDDLAALVAARTADLARANEALRAEIRQRERLEEALRQRAEQLAEEGRRKDHFLAILAHELRNPLAPLRNALEILRQPAAREPARAWAKDAMDRQLRQMGRLIDDLLDVSRINQGKIELRRERVDLSAVVSRAAESARPFLCERRHELAVSLPTAPVWLDADPLRLEQVAVNLLNNAAKYTEPGGHVRVSAEREGGEAVLRVRDTGVGIPPEMLERIFEMFAQVDRSLGCSHQWGLGIGLTLVRRLVELHGGSVRAYSAGTGRGSEFVVRLPLLKGERGVPSAERPEAANRRFG